MDQFLILLGKKYIKFFETTIAFFWNHLKYILRKNILLTIKVKRYHDKLMTFICIDI